MDGGASIGTAADLKRTSRWYEDAFDETAFEDSDLTSRNFHPVITLNDVHQNEGAQVGPQPNIASLQDAADVTTSDDPQRPARLFDLGVAYYHKYKDTDAIDDLERAIRHCQDALDATMPDDPERLNRLHTLGSMRNTRYRRTGNTRDFESAISMLREAVEAAPPDHPNLPDYMFTLGVMYRQRNNVHGALGDVEQAIQLCQSALDATSDPSKRANRMYSLAKAYSQRYLRTGAPNDIKQAIDLLQQSLAMTPRDSPAWADRTCGFGNLYRNRWLREGALEDLEEAIRLSQQTLEATPQGHPNLRYHFHYVGALYFNKYDNTKNIEDLQQAIQFAHKCVETGHKDYSSRADSLMRLAIGYGNKFLKTRQAADLTRSIPILEEALNHSPSRVQDRIRCGKILQLTYAMIKDWKLAYLAASKAVSLIPQLTPRSLQNSDKQNLLLLATGLASDAAASALNAKRQPFKAIQALETGRGVIVGSLTEMRADVSDLRSKYPLMAQEYIKTRDELDVSASPSNDMDHRNQASKELERIIGEIRTLSGFEQFLQSPSEDQLRAIAKSGPLVIINVSNYRCDALIIETDQLRALPLPDLRRKDIEIHAKNNNMDVTVLEWLWDTIARPILDALHFTETTLGDTWPRLWWIPTGPLARFPLHAAGRYAQMSSDTVLDRVISSYSSSIKAKMSSHRDSQPVNEPSSHKAVLVGMQYTPELDPLPFVAKEIDQVEKICESMRLQVERPSPLQEPVLSAISDCKVFHFAGHGQVNPRDPSRSCLLLQDWKKSPLTVASLLRTNAHSRPPFLAYLSACGTGQSKRKELIDESLHLISAFQLAGFQHVIGSLWEVNDQSCMEVAASLYTWIGERNMTHESVSEGLHHAIRRLRGQWFEENLASGALGLHRSRLAEVSDDGVGDGVMRSSYGSRFEDRNPRDFELIDEAQLTRLKWIQYVHFGI